MNKQICQVIILQSITTTSSLKDTAQELELAQLTPDSSQVLRAIC